MASIFQKYSTVNYKLLGSDSLLKKIWINLELCLVKLDDNTQCGNKYAMLCLCWSV